MDVPHIDTGAIAELGTQVATSGALRLMESVTDQIFEFTIAVVVIVQGTCAN